MILKDGIKLYHASYTVVEKIDLSLCASGKDFGKGFYIASDYNQACRFLRTAIGKALKNHIENVKADTGYISTFEYKANVNLNCYEFESADKDWLHCVVAHRKAGMLKEELGKWQDYDIIAGKIANDSTNQVITAYINGFYGEIGSHQADETAINFLLPNKLSDQICFRTEKSLLNLCFRDYNTEHLED